jgi:hypothetical protein
MPRPEIKKALIVVRTYPTPAKNGAEVSCTAAITEDGEWLRLFPVPWRYLSAEQQFRRYQWIEATVTKASDARPESYKLTQSGIRILTEPLPTTNDWQARREIIEPLRAHCLCCLMKERDANGRPTLGIFRPRNIESLIITPDQADWSPAQRAILEQGHLFAKKPKHQLEKFHSSSSTNFSTTKITVRAIRSSVLTGRWLNHGAVGSPIMVINGRKSFVSGSKKR